MSTRSIKSDRKTAGRKTRAVETDVTPAPAEVSANDLIGERTWRFGVAGILLIGAALRLYDLSLKPLHHDEGVNGNFLVRLVREGVYRYDPENYHGPTLYYFSALIPKATKLLFGSATSETYGLTTFNIRLVTALFGIATIGLVFLLRRSLGTLATLVAGLMLAISPGAVYLSRYFIHEILFIFFTLGIVVAGVRGYEKRNSLYLIPAAISAALLFATKETAVISAGVLIIALGLTLLYARINRRSYRQPADKRYKRSKPPGRFSTFIEELGGTSAVAVNAGLALLVFLLVYVLFYSSFFTNSKGIYDSFKTFEIWTKTGTKDHIHSPVTYLDWLMKQEGPLLLLGAIGAAITVLKPRNSFALFFALWAFGLIAAYSLIPYKTPWLVLNFLVPLALIAGYAVQAIYEMNRSQLKLLTLFSTFWSFGLIALWALGRITLWAFDLAAYPLVSNKAPWLVLNSLVALALIAGYAAQAIYETDRSQLKLVAAILIVTTSVAIYQSIDLNFRYYDNEDGKYVYVYAHTKRSTLELLDRIEEIAEEKDGEKTGITIVSPDYWPLPWYLRNYRVGYFGRMAATVEPIIIAKETQKTEVEANFGHIYQQVSSKEPDGSFELRPGVRLLLYRRQ